MKMKKTLKYEYEYGVVKKEKNRNENYQFIKEIIEKEINMEDESYTDQLYKKRYIEEFLTMFFSLMCKDKILL